MNEDRTASERRARALAASALTGLCLGACAAPSAARGPEDAAPTPPPSGSAAASATAALAPDPGTPAQSTDPEDVRRAFPGEPNCCKGKNLCKGQGGCKTANNECKGMNACKGLGGCRSSRCME